MRLLVVIGLVYVLNLAVFGWLWRHRHAVVRLLATPRRSWPGGPASGKGRRAAGVDVIGRPAVVHSPARGLRGAGGASQRPCPCEAFPGVK